MNIIYEIVETTNSRDGVMWRTLLEERLISIQSGKYMVPEVTLCVPC